MEIETTLQNINGSWYVRIPANVVGYFRLNERKNNPRIKDEDENTAKIFF